MVTWTRKSSFLVRNMVQKCLKPNRFIFWPNLTSVKVNSGLNGSCNGQKKILIVKYGRPYPFDPLVLKELCLKVHFWGCQMALFTRYLLEALPALMMELGFIPWWILVHLGIKNTPVPVVALGDFLRNTEPSGEMCTNACIIS